jgi:hypothetical protein
MSLGRRLSLLDYRTRSPSKRVTQYHGFGYSIHCVLAWGRDLTEVGDHARAEAAFLGLAR